MAAARIQRSSSVSASMSIDSWLVLSLRGQSKVRLLAQPGPPTQRAGPRPAARVRAGPWPSGHPRAAVRCPGPGPLPNPRAVQDAAITQPEFSFASRTINAR